MYEMHHGSRKKAKLLIIINSAMIMSNDLIFRIQSLQELLHTETTLGRERRLVLHFFDNSIIASNIG